MQLSSVLLFANLILLFTGWGRGVSRQTGIARGYLAAVAMLLLAGSAFTIPLGGAGIVHLGAVGAYWMGLVLLVRSKERAIVLLSAAFSGLVGFLLLQAAGEIPEPGILDALPALLIALVLFPGKSDGYALVILAPLFYAAFLAIEELCLFEHVYLEFGSKTQMDSIVFSLTVLPFGPVFRRLFERLIRAFPARRPAE